MSDRDLTAWLQTLPGGPFLFDPSPARLYAPADLYRGFDPERPGSLKDCVDTRIAQWLTAGEGTPRRLSMAETIAARLHDTRLDRLVADLVRSRTPSVAMMGSHSISRGHPAFLQFALIARDLARRGYLVIGGGGPGLMEAANFGAFLAPCADDVLDEALAILKRPPCLWNSEDWVASAARARAFALTQMPGGDPAATWTSPAPDSAVSLAIPTWYYGREPPNLFATHIGKYFFNSLREDGLVSVATAGIIFGMGEAGTVQEVFQNASLNYYPPDGKAAAPMVFVGREFWDPDEAAPVVGASVDRRPKPVLPLIRALAVQAERPFLRDVQVLDTAEEVVHAIVSATPPPGGRIAQAKLAAN